MDIRRDDEGYYLLDMNKEEARFLCILFRRVGIVLKDNDIIHEGFFECVKQMKKLGLSRDLLNYNVSENTIQQTRISFSSEWNFNENLKDKYYGGNTSIQ